MSTGLRWETERDDGLVTLPRPTSNRVGEFLMAAERLRAVLPTPTLHWRQLPSHPSRPDRTLAFERVSAIDVRLDSGGTGAKGVMSRPDHGRLGARDGVAGVDDGHAREAHEVIGVERQNAADAVR